MKYEGCAEEPYSEFNCGNLDCNFCGDGKSVAAIHDAIIKVMEQVGSIGKNRKNDFHKYTFRGIDDIYNELHKPLVDNGVFCTTTVVDVRREEHTSNNDGTTKTSITKTSILTCDFEFFARDGSSIKCRTVGEASDNSDKATNKAMSAAFKYCLLQLFCIPTDEPKDSENDSPSFAKNAEKEQPKKPEAVKSVTSVSRDITAPTPSSVPGVEGSTTVDGFFQADGPPTGAERKAIKEACAMQKITGDAAELALKDLKTRNGAIERLFLILSKDAEGNDCDIELVRDIFTEAYDASTSSPPFKFLEELHKKHKEIGDFVTFSQAMQDKGYVQSMHDLAGLPF